MPVALADASGGNQIAVLQFPLGAPGKTPAARLADIRVQTAKIKGLVQKASSETVMLYTTLVHGLPALLEKAGVKRGLAVSNLIVSNPFGLPEKRYLMGASVEVMLPVSVVAAGQMLNVTAVTLDEKSPARLSRDTRGGARDPQARAIHERGVRSAEARAVWARGEGSCACTRTQRPSAPQDRRGPPRKPRRRRQGAQTPGPDGRETVTKL